MLVNNFFTIQIFDAQIFERIGIIHNSCKLLLIDLCIIIQGKLL